MSSIHFTVYGKAEPAGSKRGFAYKRKGGGTGVAISDANPKSRGWKNAVAAAAFEAFGKRELLRGPLAVSFVFFQTRPRSHYRTGHNHQVLKASAPKYPTGRPDVLKLSRAVEDALTGIVWHDDSQIVNEKLFKRYADQACVEIYVEKLT